MQKIILQKPEPKIKAKVKPFEARLEEESLMGLFGCSLESMIQGYEKQIGYVREQSFTRETEAI